MGKNKHQQVEDNKGAQDVSETPPNIFELPATVSPDVEHGDQMLIAWGGVSWPCTVNADLKTATRNRPEPTQEVQGDALPPDLPPENVQPVDDAQQLPNAALLYEAEWNACLTMAFAGTGVDYMTDWGDIPFVMAQFVREHPTAPDEAVLIHVRLTNKVVVLANEDQRRVHLAVQLFRKLLKGWHEIEAQDAEAMRVAAEREAYATAPQPKLDPEGTFVETEKGALEELSDLGRAAAARAE